MRLKVEQTIKAALSAMGVEVPDAVEVQSPRDETHGDLASPVAMGLAKTLKKAPRQIAEELAAAILRDNPDTFEKVEVAGPGFLNFTFSRPYLAGALKDVLTGGKERFASDIGKGTRVQVEFVSANPTGPLHLGHGRGAALGCALSNLLEAAGYEVVREYYINDAGQQMLNLAQSVIHRYMSHYGIDYALPEDGYRGDYIDDVAQEFIAEHGDRYKGDTGPEAIAMFQAFALKKMTEKIKEDLESFGVRFDNWQSELELHTSGAVQHAIDFLADKGLIQEKDGAKWFLSEKFGDDKDRVVIKADGKHTYFASDIAYHLKKVENGFDEVIDIWGADHHGYVPRLGAVMDALGPGREHLKVLLVQMVSLLRDGEPVQMSKRKGSFVTLTEVMDEVGADTTKFIFLTRRHDSQLAFDLETAKAQSSENPVYYIQYANARITSIFRKAHEEGVLEDGQESLLADAALTRLIEPSELKLIRQLLHYPQAIETAALAREPHRLTFYLQELAGVFHPFYKQCRVLTEDRELSMARLALCTAVREVIRHGLTVLGISAPDRM